jgi:hypothetical protein
MPRDAPRRDDLTLWRDDHEFAQRFEATISLDHDTIDGRWRSGARVAVGHDLHVLYRRSG